MKTEQLTERTRRILREASSQGSMNSLFVPSFLEKEYKKDPSRFITYTIYCSLIDGTIYGVGAHPMDQEDVTAFNVRGDFVGPLPELAENLKVSREFDPPGKAVTEYIVNKILEQIRQYRDELKEGSLDGLLEE